MGGRPGPKTFTPSLRAQENKVCRADVLDPRGSQKNFMQENFELIFVSSIRSYIRNCSVTFCTDTL